MYLSRLSLFVSIGFTIAVTGCGGRKWDAALPTFPVEGQVLRDGKPFAQAMVILHPQQAADGRIQPARGTTDNEGRFKLTTYNHEDGAAVGDYVATVEYYEPIKEGGSVVPGPNIVPPEYSVLSQSKIKVHVSEGGTKLDPIDIHIE